MSEVVIGNIRRPINIHEKVVTVLIVFDFFMEDIIYKCQQTGTVPFSKQNTHFLLLDPLYYSQ